MKPDYEDENTGRKRKAVEEREEEDLSEKSQKRKRNREAAKKCRERKVQETENLKKKNDELQKENCDLVRQRDDLMEKCLKLEKLLLLYREQGCNISEYSPLSSDLSDILDPNISPSFATSQTPSASPCPSPVPLASLLPVDTSSYEKEAVPVRPVTKAVTPGQKSVTVHQTANRRGGNSQVTWAPMREAKVEPATSASAASQSAVLKQPVLEQLAICTEFMDENGCRTKLHLSQEDYMRLVARGNKSVSVQLRDLSSTFVNSPSQSQVASATQLPKQEARLVSAVDQSAEYETEASLQNCQQSDMFTEDTKPMSCSSDTAEGKETEDLEEYLVVNPNDILMDLDEQNFDLLQDEAFEAMQPKVDNIKVEDIFTTHSDGKVLTEQMFTVQGNSSDTNAVTKPVSEHSQLVKIQTISKTADNFSSSNGSVPAIAVTDPYIISELGHIAAHYSPVSGRLPQGTVENPMTGQAVMYNSSADDAASLCLSGATDSTVPVLFHAKTSFLSCPFKTDYIEVSDQQPVYDTTQLMETVKLRPKAAQFISLPSSRGPFTSAQSSHNRVAFTQATGAGPQKEIIWRSAQQGIPRLQASCATLPHYDRGLQLQVSQQQSFPVPRAPVYSKSRQPVTQSLPIQGQQPVQEEKTPKWVLETVSTRTIKDYLEQNSLEVLDMQIAGST